MLPYFSSTKGFSQDLKEYQKVQDILTLFWSSWLYIVSSVWTFVVVHDFQGPLEDKSRI